MLLETNRCFTSPPQVAPPPPQTGHLDPSRSRVLQCLGSWAIKNVVFSYVWGVMAPMGKLVTCLGRLGRQNRIKGSRRVCFGGHCLLFFRKKRDPEREGSQVAFSLLASKAKTDQLCDRNLAVQDLPESSV